MRAGLDSQQQRLRLGDLRHLGRRREAFERGREDGVSIGQTADRLVELGQRQRRAQLEAARALLFCDSDGGQERFFRRRGIGGVALNRMSPRARCSSASNVRWPKHRPSPALRRGWLRRGWIAGLGLGFRQGNLYETVKNQDVLRA